MAWMPRAGVVFLAAMAVGATPAAAAVGQVGGCVIGPETQCPGADLSRADLSGADLRFANLRGASLAGANLDRANLHGADLTHAVLNEAIGRRANLSSVRLSGSKMHFANFHNANFNGSQVDHAHLSALDAQHASMRGTNFAASSLHLASLNHADLHGSNWVNANLSLTQLTAADLTGANFAGAHFGHTQTHHAKTHHTNFWPSNFDSDHLAVVGVYEKVKAHIDAYGNWGFCGSPRLGDWEKHRIDVEDGYCNATPQPGGSHGFDGGGRISYMWTWSRHHDLTLRGHHGVKLEGRTSTNWGALDVKKLEGLWTHVSEGRPVGHPGGPIAMNLTRQSYYQNITLNYGYTMRLDGWLRRKPMPDQIYGPKPQ